MPPSQAPAGAPAWAYGLPVRGTALLLALVAALLAFRLGDVGLLGPDEPRYSRVAVEMQRAGRWVRPTLQGEPWLEKPPLFYWLAGAAFAALGENEAAARLPSVLAALLLVGGTALVGARLYGGGAGLYAGFAAGTSVLVFAYGRAASMDMLLAATVTAAIGLLALDFFRIAGRLALPVAFAFIGLATLAKGPLGVLLPALVVLGFALASRRFALLGRMFSPVGIVLFLLVAAPWYVLVWLDQGQAFVDVFLLDHNVQRFTSTVHRHPGPVFYYVPVLLLGLFPWSGLLLPAFAAPRPRGDGRDLFVLLWFALPFAFFSLAGSKLPGYILPCIPPLALLVGRAARDLTAGDEGLERWKRHAGTTLATLGMLVAAAPFAFRWRGEPGWLLLVPSGLWALIVTTTVARRLQTDAAAALRLLRVGAAGLLLLLGAGLPPILERRESGRRLWAPADDRPALAFGAWRTAWMAGYFYNDGQVRWVESLDEVERAAAENPALVVCGPGERRQLEALEDYEVTLLAEGPRENALVRLRARKGPSE